MRSLFFAATLFATNLCFGQVKITFEKKNIDMVRQENEDIISHIKLNIEGNVETEDSIKVYIQSTTNTTFKIDTIRRKINVGQVGLEVPFMVPRGKSSKKDSVILIASYKKAISEIKIVIEDKVAEFKETGDGMEEYKISIGHSFDFFDQTNRFISQARFDAFKPDLISKKSGLHFYVYQNQFNTSTSLSNFGDSARVLDRVAAAPRAAQTGDRAFFAINFYNRTTQSTFKSFGFGFNTLTKISGANTTSGTSIYLTSGFEYIRREIKFDYTYTLSSTDTIKQPKTFPLRLSTSIKQRKTTYNEVYGGVGIIVNNINAVAHTRLKYTLGYLLSQGDISSSFNPLESKVGFSHWFNIELIEKLTKVNFTLGIDWRQNQGTGFLYNVYLSKSFSIGKLKDLIFEE